MFYKRHSVACPVYLMFFIKKNDNKRVMSIDSEKRKFHINSKNNTKHGET